MFTLPIIAFYISFYYIFHTKDIPEAWSGGAAIVTANIVLASYIISAFNEDDDDINDKDNDNKLKNAPKVGIFKDRTD